MRILIVFSMILLLLSCEKEQQQVQCVTCTTSMIVVNFKTDEGRWIERPTAGSKYTICDTAFLRKYDGQIYSVSNDTCSVISITNCMGGRP